MGKIRKWMSGSRFAMAATLALQLGAGLAVGEDKNSVGTVMAKLLVTVEGKKDTNPPELKRDDVRSGDSACTSPSRCTPAK